MTKANTHAKAPAPSANAEAIAGAGTTEAAGTAGTAGTDRTDAKAVSSAPPGAQNATKASIKKARRTPLSLLALGGILVALGYGIFVLGMRMGPPLVMVALGGMTLALCGAALWRVIDPLTRDEVAAVQEVRAPHRLRELEREKQAVLKAIKEIELDFQMRKISQADYREMVERYRTRALRVMGDLAAGDDYRALIERELKARLAARAAANVGSGAGRDAWDDGEGPAGQTDAIARDAGEPVVNATSNIVTVSGCPTCATVNDTDAQFCKQCGTQMTFPAGPV